MQAVALGLKKLKTRQRDDTQIKKMTLESSNYLESKTSKVCILGRAMLFLPKSFYLLSTSFLSPMIPVSLSVLRSLQSPLLQPQSLSTLRATLHSPSLSGLRMFFFSKNKFRFYFRNLKMCLLVSVGSFSYLSRDGVPTSISSYQSGGWQLIQIINYNFKLVMTFIKQFNYSCC